MEFPVVKEIYRDDLNNDKLENLVNSPSLHVLDASAFEPKELFSFIQEINEKRYLLFLVALIIFSACSPVETENTPTLPPLYNEKPLVTPTLLSLYTTRPTNTPKVFPTSTPLIIPPTSEPVPRWTILSQPGYGVELLGETWDYVTDRWGDSFACIKYENEEGIYTWFEQCFAFITPDTTFEGILAPFIENGYQEIIPQNDYAQTGKHILVGKA